MKIQSGTWQGFVTAEREAQGPLVLDLSELKWADPVVAAGTAAVAQRAAGDGRQVSFVSPVQPNPKTYLSRMHLGRALDDLGIVHDLPIVNENDRRGSLLELQTFATEYDGEALAGLVRDRTQETRDVDRQVLEPLHESLVELATNVTLHADVQHGYAVAQTYPQKGCIKFCIADSGIGFRASLDRNAQLHPDDDAHALEMAVIRQMTGTDDVHRGYGLHTVVESVRGLGGIAEIASGVASATFSREGEGGNFSDTLYTSSLPSVYGGVIVQVTIPWAPGDPRKDWS